MTLIGEVLDFKNKTVSKVVINQQELLLVCYNNQFYLIDNKCGHFGLPLQDGEVSDECIVCPHHGISFSLTSGEVVNRPYENCDSIGVYAVLEQEGKLYWI